MKTVYKYPFIIQHEVIIRLPRGFEVLRVAIQDGTPCLWALVDTEEPSFDWQFRIFGTGQEVYGVRDHIATFQSGLFVWHMFRV